MGAVQGLERHVSRLFVVWNRDALSGFAAGLSQAVERNLRAAGWGCELQQPAAPCLSAALAADAAEGSVPLPASPGSHAMLLQGVHAQPGSPPAVPRGCTAGKGQDSAELEIGAGGLAAGPHVETAEPGLAPSTPAGRDVRSPLAATPVPQPITGQVITQPVHSQRGQEAASVGAAGSRPPSSSRAALLAEKAAPDRLAAWAARQPSGDPAAALVLASAAATAACDMGLASGAGPVPWPAYLIGTRDSFAHHLHAQPTEVTNGWSAGSPSNEEVVHVPAVAMEL